jgi:hypothetical protein
MREGERRGRTVWLAALVAACLAALLLGFVATPLDRRFDTDEFQHLQMGWLIHAGVVPYRDFFEHHTPVFHFALQPVFAALDVAASAGDAVLSVRVARVLARALALLLVVGTFLLGARLGGPLTGAASALSLASLSFFVQKGLEIRPDHLGALGLVAAVLALLAAARAPAAAERSAPVQRALFAAAGAATAFALLATQKTLMAWPGLGLALLLAARAGPKDGRARRSVEAAAAAAAGAALAAAPVLLWFAARGALDEFLRQNFLLNARWPAQTPVARMAGLFASENPLLLALAVAGVAAGLAPARRGQALFALAPLASLLAGLAVVPIALAQYYFLALPFLSVFSGLALATAAARPRGRLGAAAAALLALAVAGSGARHVERARREPRGADVLAKLEYVVTQTPASASVLSSWSPGLIYRRPAFFYWSLHREIRRVIPPAEYEELRAGLESGRISPELVEMDKHMLRLPEPIVRHLEAHYAPVGVGTLWRRK